MSSVWNPVTIDYRDSVNTPDFPAPWVVNHKPADILREAGVPLRYWKNVSGVATEMDGPEKAAADSLAISLARDAKTAENVDSTESITRAVALATLDSINAQAQAITAILNAIDVAVTLVDLKAQVGMIADPAKLAIAQLRTQIRAKLGT